MMSAELFKDLFSPGRVDVEFLVIIFVFGEEDYRDLDLGIR